MGTAYVLRTRTGESVLCADLATLFAEAERLPGADRSARRRPARALERGVSRIPITLITGFLGSGKTTLLRELLADPALGETAVLVNELGEIALDHHLLSRIDERTVVLASGCVCCTIRADLADELRDARGAARARRDPGYERVAIETTGLADPAPILSTLLSDPMLEANYRVDGVVTTVDAVNGVAQLRDQPEAAKQAAVADRLLITKTDLAEPAAARRAGAPAGAGQPGSAADRGQPRADRRERGDRRRGP